jgi:predicted membrane-bound spermidine synthase
MLRSKHSSSSDLGCGTLIAILLINLVLGAWSINYILMWFGKDIPFIADALIGLFVGEISIPVAFVGWLLKVCGVF